MSVRIIVCGACGKMGGNVLSLLGNDPEAVAVCGVDLYPREIGIPVYKSFAEIKEEADVIIDFSSPIGLTERLEYAKTHGLGIVLASTAFHVATVEVVGLIVHPLFCKIGTVIPVGVITSTLQERTAFTLAKSIWEDLINNTRFQPIWGFIVHF